MNEVTNPAHYLFDLPCKEVRDVIRDRTSVYLDSDLPEEGLYDYLNAIKYVLRAPAKAKRKDLRKARYVLDSLIGLCDDDDAAANQPVEREPDLDVPKSRLLTKKVMRRLGEDDPFWWKMKESM